MNTIGMPLISAKAPFQFAQEIPSFPSDSCGLQAELPHVKRELKCIVIVDDEVMIADSLAQILNCEGYDALPFYSGHTAIDFSRGRCPDLVISDVVMPRINGIETVIAIQEHCPGARVLLFSGQAGTADLLDRAREKGYEFELLPKPIHPEHLLKRISAFRRTPIL